MPIVRKSRAGAEAGADSPIRTTPSRKASARRAQSQGESVSEEVLASAVPVAPVPASGKSPGARQRKRLAKAFPRPLDKMLKKNAAKAGKRPKDSSVVRDAFTFREAEYAALVGIKKQLAEQGVTAKKSELVRVGVGLVASLSPQKIQSLLARLPPLD